MSATLVSWGTCSSHAHASCGLRSRFLPPYCRLRFPLSCGIWIAFDHGIRSRSFLVWFSYTPSSIYRPGLCFPVVSSLLRSSSIALFNLLSCSKHRSGCVAMSNEQNDQNAAPFQNPEGFEDADFQIGGNGGPEGSDAESSSSSSDIVGKFLQSRTVYFLCAALVSGLPL